jgi:hypothetical protein
MRCSASLLLLLAFSLPAAALETPVADPVRSGTRGFEVPEAAASDGTDTLFIWRSEESVFGEHYAARVTRDGVTLDRVVLPLRQRIEHLVWTGNSYLIVWTEQSAGGRFSIESLRLDRNGNPITGTSSPFRTLKQDAFSVACVANGKNVVIAYTGYSYTIQTRRPQALVLNADGVPVADLLLANADWRLSYDIAWNGAYFAAVWIAGNGDGAYDDPRYAVHGIRFDPAGLLDRAPAVLFEATARPPQFGKVALQSDGQSFLLFNQTDGRTLARRVSGDLATLSPSHLLPDWVDHSSYTKTFWIGPDYLLLGRTSGATVGLRLDRDGNAIETKVIDSAPGSSILDPIVAATNGGDVAVAWAGFVPGFGCADSDLFTTVASTATLERRLQVLVSQGPRDQQSSLVAAGDTNLLAAWRSGSAIYARRFLPDGSPLDANPLFLAECASLLAVSFNGHDYFLFLSRNGGFEIRRVPRDGPLRAEQAATVNGVLIAAVRTKSGTAILWGTSESSYVSRLSAEGTLLQTGSLGQLGSPDARPRSIAMAASEDDFLIVWQQPGKTLYCTPPTFGSPPSPGYCYDRSLIRGARVSGDLVNRDPFGFDVSAVSPFEFDPKVTWNGHAWLVVWHSDGTPRSVDGPRLPEEIRGRFVARDGTLDENPTGVVIATAATSPAIEWDGARYVVSWQRYDGGAYPPLPRTTRIGWLPDLGRPFLSMQEIASAQERPVVAATSAGTAVATYSRLDANVVRAFVNLIEPGNAGAKRRPAR